MYIGNVKSQASIFCMPHISVIRVDMEGIIASHDCILRAVKYVTTCFSFYAQYIL